MGSILSVMTGHVRRIEVIVTVCKNMLQLRAELSIQTSLLCAVILVIYLTCNRKIFSACCMLGSILFSFCMFQYVIKLI